MYVEINRGSNFKALAKYCLYDHDGPTSSRVAFVETRNLATDDPEAAWRGMAARSYIQSELKRKAGVAPQGRRNGKPVGHLIISWSKAESDAQNLDRRAMIRAADGALSAIDANNHHAMIIGHNGTDNPHCHVIIDLIGEDGRLKKNWQEKRKLSKFALDHEMTVHGAPVVKTRQENHIARLSGSQPKNVKKKPRYLYELEIIAQGRDGLGLRARELIKVQARLREMESQKSVRIAPRHDASGDWLRLQQFQEHVRVERRSILAAYRKSNKLCEQGSDRTGTYQTINDGSSTSDPVADLGQRQRSRKRKRRERSLATSKRKRDINRRQIGNETRNDMAAENATTQECTPSPA